MENTSGDDLHLPLFPEDVLIEILVWLPLISLLRFQSVCKSWRALIQSPLFINLHAATTPKFDTFILQVFEDPRTAKWLEIDPDTLETDDPDDDTWPSDEYTWMENGTKMIMLTSESGSGGEEGDNQVLTLYDLEFSSCFQNFLLSKSIPIAGSFVHMIGSCNGLVCLHAFELKEIFLWNPATRQFRVLPRSIPIEERILGTADFVFVTFGYDVKTKDYKVMQIIQLGTTNIKEWTYQIQVYSLRTDSWRIIEGIDSLHVSPDYELGLNNGIYMNGSYFFVAKIFPDTAVLAQDGSMVPLCNNSLMMAFDFTKEIFTTVHFPDHDTRHKLVLSYLGDKIALFTARQSSIEGRNERPDDTREHDDNEYYDIWVLNEHDYSIVTKESWTKLHSFTMKFIDFPLSQPRCILNNGEYALISNKTDDREWAKLQFINLVTKEVKEAVFSQNVLRADVYKQTLVSVNSGIVAAAADDQ